MCLGIIVRPKVSVSKGVDASRKYVRMVSAIAPMIMQSGWRGLKRVPSISDEKIYTTASDRGYYERDLVLFWNLLYQI